MGQLGNDGNFGGVLADIVNYIPSITLPKTIYVLNNDTFSIYYKNVIKYSKTFLNGAYCIVGMIKNVDSSYGTLGSEFIAYDYKLDFTPTSARTLNLEFRIIKIFTNEVVSSKVVQFIVVSSLDSKTLCMSTIGDSFTDGGNGISALLYDALTANNVTVESVGLNSGSSLTVPAVRDDAYSGKGYIWFTTQAMVWWNELRDDRPLSDAIWDAGWGKGETYGWTDGQVYANLTDIQKTHGYTKNSFWNPSTNQFDYSYYINTYMNDGRYPNVLFKPIGNDTLGTGETGKTIKHVDSFASFCGLNDIIWTDMIYDSVQRNALINAVKVIVTSVWAYDPQIKIFLHTVTPQRDNDESLQKIAYFDDNFKHYEKSKLAQEIWNDMLITEFEKAEYVGKPIYIIPTSAHLDTRYSYTLTTVYPNKFDTSITEQICSDIHPMSTGYKYITDCAKNIIYAKAAIKVAGYTNLLGTDGNCEDISKWSGTNGDLALNTANKVFGTYCIEVASWGTDNFGLAKTITINPSKYYMLSGYMKNINDQTTVSLGLYTAAWATIKTSTTTIVTNQSQRCLVRISPSDLGINTSAYLSFTTTGNLTSGDKSYFDGIMLNEISSADYALSDVDLLAKYTFV